MEEQKYKRVRNAVIFGAVLLVIVLLSILIFQLVKIKNDRKELQYLKEQIAVYRTLTEEEKDSLEAMNTREWIEQKARELGLTLEGDFALD